jgi:membrane protease YdiL (CAAX protease family)
MTFLNFEQNYQILRKRSLYLLGLITLIVFPIPTFVVLYYFYNIQPFEILQFESFQIIPVGFGLQLGFIYGILALLLMKSRIFDDLPVNIEQVVKRMRLNFLDALLLSLCAGIGEELLFRSGVQFFLDPVTTSIIFIAIHGYLNPLNWRMSIYGLIILPFVLLISYGFEYFGLWFAIAAHFMYDFVLFRSISLDSSNDDRKSIHS